MEVRRDGKDINVRATLLLSPTGFLHTACLTPAVCFSRFLCLTSLSATSSAPTTASCCLATVSSFPDRTSRLVRAPPSCSALTPPDPPSPADESAMTGESKAVHKSAHFPFMVGGSKLVSGDSRMLVTTVGENTSYGQIVKRLQDEPEKETPLQEKLTVLALQIGYLGFVVGTLTVIVLLIAYFASGTHDNAGTDGEPSVFISILRMIVLGITIVVVAVPEGLPLAVTISLAFSMKRMYNDKCLVRELAACETMGSATCICSDKTGTLTENRMTVRQGFINGRFIAEDPSKPEQAGDATDVQVIGQCCALNSTARLEYRNNNDGKPTYLDAPTEGCLLHMVYKGFGVDFDALRQSDTYMDAYFRQPFSSERKRMTSMYEGKEEWHGDFVVFCKGASEIVLGDTISTYYRAPGGKTLPLDDKLDAATAGELEGAKEGQTMRAYLLEKVDAMATKGLRTLSIGYKSIKNSELPHGHEDSDSRDTILGQALEAGTLEEGLIITGVVGIEDPVREGVPEAVATCKQAGIRVRMVTGDNKKTAESIARQCGILSEGGLVMLGKEFRALSEEERMEVLPKLDVMARSSPNDKLLMVRGLRAMGETVSVTGDGTNDAPALVAADIGLAMGITGTEVAKEASKIVITDDKFTSIVTAVKWGRSVLKNIRSFLQFQLTINIVALSVTFVVATTNNGDTSNFPINPVQLLWINLIMDSFAALALATEPPDDHLLTEKPVRRDDALITNYMWRNMIGHSIVQTAILLWMSLSKSGAEVFLIDSDKHFQDETHYTAVFNAFVWLQIFNKFNARKLRNELNVFEGLFDSYISVGVILIIIAGQVFIVEVGGDITSTVGLTWEAWLISIAIGAISLPVGFLLKFYEPPQVDCPNLFAYCPGAGNADKAESDEVEGTSAAAAPKAQGAWSTKAAPADDGAVLPAADAEDASSAKTEDGSKLVAP